MAWVFATEGSSAFTINGIQKTRLTGFSGGVTRETKSIDVCGNVTVSQTTVNRDARTTAETVQYPDSSNLAQSVTVNGLLVSSTGKTGLETTYSYDALERQTAVANPRTGMSTTHYNDKGQVDWVEDTVANRTSYAYDPDTGRMACRTPGNSIGSAAQPTTPVSAIRMATRLITAWNTWWGPIPQTRIPVR